MLDLVLCLALGAPLLLAEPASGEAPCVETAGPVLGRRLLDAHGQSHRIGDQGRGVALVFLMPGCPVASRAVPELHRVFDLASETGIELYGVLSDPTLTPSMARTFCGDLSLRFPVLLDGAGDLYRALLPTHVPEVFVLGGDGRCLYRGRIDDGAADLTVHVTPTTHDLRDAVLALSLGKAPLTVRTRPVGCFLEAWDEKGESEEREVVYTRDIAPLLQANCVDCHREGEVAPFPLLTHEDARKRARLIAHVTEKRLMPPWKAEPGFGRFQDERILSEEEIARLGAWARSGAKEGDPKWLPAPPSFAAGWSMGEPDLVLEPGDGFTMPAEGEDVFRCFVLPTGLLEDKGVIGVEFRPGAREVVHHAIFYLDATGRARELDRADEGPGYSRFGGPGFTPSGALGGWAPGASPHTYPKGVGRRIHAGEDVVLQIHYHASGREVVDRSRIGLRFATEPLERVVRGLVVGRQDLDIPAGEARHEVRARLTLPVDVELTGVTPHMHLLGKEMKATAMTPDGHEIPLAWIRDWDYDWQGQYRYRDPLFLPEGTRIDLVAVYDNSEGNPRNPSRPPARVRSGEGTTDEMCFFFLNYVSPDPQAPMRLRGAMLRSFLEERAEKTRRGGGDTGG